MGAFGAGFEDQTRTVYEASGYSQKISLLICYIRIVVGWEVIQMTKFGFSDLVEGRVSRLINSERY